MADRKVLNKYFPPDFDPNQLWQKKRYLKKRDSSGRVVKVSREAKQMQMRMMFPFTICCSLCREFTYAGTKFNSRVEKVVGEDYLGIAVWRFFGNCPNCRNTVSFKTDPKNGDYVLEFGGSRTYDPLKDVEKAQEALKELEKDELAGDKVKQMEAKTYNTQIELQALEVLDEIRTMNKRLLDRHAAADMALKYIQENEVSSSSSSKGGVHTAPTQQDLEREEDEEELRRYIEEKKKREEKREASEDDPSSSSEGGSVRDFDHEARRRMSSFREGSLAENNRSKCVWEGDETKKAKILGVGEGLKAENGGYENVEVVDEGRFTSEEGGIAEGGRFNSDRGKISHYQGRLLEKTLSKVKWGGDANVVKQEVVAASEDRSSASFLEGASPSSTGGYGMHVKFEEGVKAGETAEAFKKTADVGNTCTLQNNESPSIEAKHREACGDEEEGSLGIDLGGKRLVKSQVLSKLGDGIPGHLIIKRKHTEAPANSEASDPLCLGYSSSSDNDSN